MCQSWKRKINLFTACFICLGLSCCGKEKDITPLEDDSKELRIIQQEELKTKQVFSSSTSKEDCVLCSNGSGTMISMYRGQKNLGIISLNTMDIAYIGINQYDDESTLVEKPTKHTSTTIDTFRDGGFTSMVSENPNRGFATGSITFSENASLNIQKASQFLCSDCTNSILDSCWSDNPYGVGLIDFSERRIRLFEKDITGFLFGDYYISCDYGNREELINQDMDFLIFYCPERYGLPNTK